MAALAIIGCIICAVSVYNRGDGGENGDTPQYGGAPTADQNAPGIGTAVRDGDFEFVVNGVECGVQEVGQDPLSERAQGQFCLVDTSVKNIGTQSQTLYDNDQKAFAANGNEFSADSAAGLLANEANNQVWITPINPGNEVRGKIVYDVPQDVQLTQIELHDSSASGGVKVKLQ